MALQIYTFFTRHRSLHGDGHYPVNSVCDILIDTLSANPIEKPHLHAMLSTGILGRLQAMAREASDFKETSFHCSPSLFHTFGNAQASTKQCNRLSHLLKQPWRCGKKQAISWEKRSWTSIFNWSREKARSGYGMQCRFAWLTLEERDSMPSVEAPLALQADYPPTPMPCLLVFGGFEAGFLQRLARWVSTANWPCIDSVLETSPAPHSLLPRCKMPQPITTTESLASPPGGALALLSVLLQQESNTCLRVGKYLHAGSSLCLVMASFWSVPIPIWGRRCHSGIHHQRHSRIWL